MSDKRPLFTDGYYARRIAAGDRPDQKRPAREREVLISKKELADLRSAKIALSIEQKRHAKARRRIHELERAALAKVTR